MPLKMHDATILQTDAVADFYGADPYSISMWVRLDPSYTGWTDGNHLFDFSNYQHTWLNLAGDGIFVQANVHNNLNSYNPSTTSRLAPSPTVGQAYHFALTLGSGGIKAWVNGILGWSPGYVNTSEGVLNANSLERLMLGCYTNGGFSVQDVAIWKGYALTQTDAKALRDRIKTPDQIGTGGTLKCWIPLNGTEGHAPTPGDASLTDLSGSGLSITSIQSGSPTYDPIPMTFTFPSYISKALITPGRKGLVLFFKDRNNNQVNVVGSSGLVDPTLTTQSLNGGAPFTLTNAIWGPSGTYLPWVYYPLPSALAPTDTPVLNVSDPWCSTTAGPVQGLTNYACDNTIAPARATLLPDFSYLPNKTMRVGYNAPKVPVSYSTLPVYTNYTKQISGWYNASYSVDSNGVPTQVGAGQTLLAAVVTPPSDGTTSSKGYSVAPADGVWALMWDGQALDGSTPILTLGGGGASGCNITPTGTDSMTGTDNRRLFHITQDQTYTWSPTIYLQVHGTGVNFSPALSNIRLYGPDPSNPSVPLSDTPSKFHPTLLNALTGAKCLRFSLGGDGGDIANYSDFHPTTMLGYGMEHTNWRWLTISRVDPYSDTENFFGNAATMLVTFTGQHYLNDGALVSLNIPGPNTDDSFPVTPAGAAPGDKAGVMQGGTWDNGPFCRYNSSTMTNAQIAIPMTTTGTVSAKCTLTQAYTTPPTGKTWSMGGLAQERGQSGCSP